MRGQQSCNDHDIIAAGRAWPDGTATDTLPGARRLGNRSWAIPAGLLGLLLLLLPLLVVTIPPLTDYPNHLARIAILHALPTDPFLAEHYRVASWLVPNLLFDVVVYALAMMLPLEAAGRLFVALTIVLLVGGTIALHRTLHGRTSWWPLLSLLVVPNWPLLMGFMSYVAGVGLMLLATALWLRLSQQPWLLRLAAGAACALALFFTHIVVLVLFAAVVGGCELQAAASRLRVTPSRAACDLLLTGLAFLPAAGLFLAGSPTGTLATAAAPIYDLPEKLAALPAALTSGVMEADVITLLLVPPLVLLAMVALRFSFARPFTLALLAAALVFCLLPNRVPPSAIFLDTRVLPALLLLTLAATNAMPRRPRLAALLAAAIAGLVVLRSTAVTLQWASFEPRVQAYRAAFRALPAGSTLFTVRQVDRKATPRESTSTWQPTPARVRARLSALLVTWTHKLRITAPLHLGTIAAFEARAFVPRVFVEHGLQPIAVHERWAEAVRLQRGDEFLVVHDAELAALVPRLRAAAHGRPAFLLLVAGGGEPGQLLLPAGIGEAGRGPSFRLLCLARCGSAAPTG